MKQTKKQMLHDILGELGSGRITIEQYRKIMADKKLTEQDVDDYCAGKLK